MNRFERPGERIRPGSVTMASSTPDAYRLRPRTRPRNPSSSARRPRWRRSRCPRAQSSENERTDVTSLQAAVNVAMNDLSTIARSTHSGSGAEGRAAAASTLANWPYVPWLERPGREPCERGDDGSRHDIGKYLLE